MNDLKGDMLNNHKSINHSGLIMMAGQLTCASS